jgi:hypothetical protein
MIGGSSPGRSWEFFSSLARPNRLWGPPSLLSNRYRGTLSQEVKWLGHEPDHSLTSCADVMNAWSHISTPQYVTMAWYLRAGSNLPLSYTKRRSCEMSLVLPGPWEASKPLICFSFMITCHVLCNEQLVNGSVSCNMLG